MTKKIKMKPVATKKGIYPIDDIELIPWKPEGIPPEQREGVFVHSFECINCRVHFNVFSWKPANHGTNNVYCPECGKRGAFIHHRATLNENPQMTLNGKEIFNWVPFPGSELMDDTNYKLIEELIESTLKKKEE